MDLPLLHGLVALIDSDDFERAGQLEWRINDNGYVIRNIKRSDGSWTTQRLSRFIMNAPEGVYVDHIHGNKLDNRKSELRFATHTQNLWNRGKTRKNTSGFKGVLWDKRKSKWRAEITVSGKLIHLGYFDDIVEAAEVREAGSKKYHGEFART